MSFYPGPNGIRQWIAAKPISCWRFWINVFTGKKS
jgi:hypothetical protein